MKYISVILPLKLEWEPCYSLSESEEAQVGDRVKVMFANREYFGVVSATDIKPDTDPKKIKPILFLERDMERILPKEIDLWRTVADYYLCSTGEVYKAAYPYGKTSMEEMRATAKSKVRQRREKLMNSIVTKIERLESRLDKKKAMLLKARKESTREAYSQEILKLKEEIVRSTHAFEAIQKDKSETGYDDVPCKTIGIDLTEAQDKAYTEIKHGFSEGKPVLLHGVTGSGKTEIYMKLAQEFLVEGKNVLYLVPEIALSRQLEDRLSDIFGDSLLTFHSGESAASRRNVAETIRTGIGYIVLGTRSSLFLPHQNLGLIIVDEEHDNSYKQDSPAPRYNGRDTALMLHRIHECNIILGSATPSLEEIYNCEIKKHRLVELRERYHGSDDAEIKIIDTKAERRKNGMKGSFSRKLIDHIDRTIQNGGQVIILRSRRAWAPVMQCDACGEILKCPHCNVSLSYHRNGRMTCHYCGYSEAYPGTCRKCGGSLRGLGAGTQKIEEEAAALFPNARIARLDSDTAQSKTYETQTIRSFSKGEIDILIGTQIVSKGFDFSNLRLVAVIAADSLLGMQDFRADEKALQLLEQFRGRCGRREEKGLFLIQTSQPEHPVYQSIAKSGTMEYNASLMMERKDFNFPPFSRIIEISVRDIYEDRADRMSKEIGGLLRAALTSGTESILDSPVTGPYVPVVDKVADRYIRTIRVCLKKDRNLSKSKTAVRTVIQEFEKKRKYDGHITINVDPS
ncbi:MAG: primosomal protein N' [Bacteroidales bacterium]|nr:primosomal protein N' [Bacteroidales bacterium]